MDDAQGAEKHHPFRGYPEHPFQKMLQTKLHFECFSDHDLISGHFSSNKNHPSLKRLLLVCQALGVRVPPYRFGPVVPMVHFPEGDGGCAGPRGNPKRPRFPIEVSPLTNSRDFLLVDIVVFFRDIPCGKILTKIVNIKSMCF